MDALTQIVNAIEQYLNQLDAIQFAHQTCSEHDVIQYLHTKDVTPFGTFDIKQSKDLFRAHFLCMHALYHLQNRYYQDQTYHLEITSIRISRLAYRTGETGISHPDPLRTYYLDIRHYFETSEEEVNQLLNKFWQKFLTQEDKTAALAILELPINSDYASIKKQYRKLAQKHHPDKGGSSEHFAKINAAKNLLDKAF